MWEDGLDGCVRPVLLPGWQAAVRRDRSGYIAGMDIAGSVIVVTGASSGIGRASALLLAELGARTVLVARREVELTAVAAECDRRSGITGSALVAPADVTDSAAVEDVAARAVDHFGRLDGWVNSAGVTGFGSLLGTPLSDIEGILRVNVMGTVHGARAALPRMIEQGSGVLVNLSSILGVVAPPLTGPYAMTKFAVRALGGSLREELRIAGARGVAVGTVLPAAIDTPIYAAAANRTGRRVQPPPPVYPPERVARAVVAMLRRPRPELVAGGVLGRAFVATHAVLPRTAERMMALDMSFALRHPARGPATSGALHEPGPVPGGVDGGFGGAHKERRRRRAALAVLALSTAAGLGAVTRAVAS